MVSKIGVIGAGQMGNGIAQTAAAAGYEVIMVDIQQDFVDRGLAAVDKSLAKFVEKGKLSQDDATATRGRLSGATDNGALADCDLVIEAIVERLDIKTKLWQDLDGIVKDSAIFASNTSSIPITKLAAATKRPSQFIGMHFMNPVPLMKLIEVIKGHDTSDATLATILAVGEKMGKQCHSCEDYPGFVSNRILCPMLNEAIFCLQEGVGTKEDIDAIMKLGMNHPMGPLTLADFVGLDTLLAILDVLYEGFGDPKYRAAPLLRKMVQAGHLGRKTGRGFYEYRRHLDRPVFTRRSHTPFHHQRAWVAASFGALALAAFLPIFWPPAAPVLARITPLLSLFCFLAAIGVWLRMRNRSFLVAAVLTGLIYAVSAWTPAWGLEDFFVIAVISSLLVFALAGFNMVFILEEMVFDVQRLSHFQRPFWKYVPSLVVLLGVVVLPQLPAYGLPAFRTLWIAAIIHVALLSAYWIVRAVNGLRDAALRELHLLVAGTLAMAAMVDTINIVGNRSGLFPSLFGYAILVGTWLYVSYTTLQRTHFLLGSKDAVPWLLILMAASFSLVHHAFFHFRVEQSYGVALVLNQRLAYFVVGIGIGMAVYIVQATWRIFKTLRDDRQLSGRGRIAAGRVARGLESVFFAERALLEGTAYSVYKGLDAVLPGVNRVPRHHGWELDGDSLQLIKDEEE